MVKRITAMAAEHAAQAAGDYGVMLSRGTLEIGYYVPDGVDNQQPHEQDEVYVVHRGYGYFVVDGVAEAFIAGDTLFVAAGVPHHFEKFSEDFAAWVIFYGPKGGEGEDSGAEGVSR